MQKRTRIVFKRIGRFFPFISATLLILLAFQNCGQPKLGGDASAPFDPLVYKIDLESGQVPTPLQSCFDSTINEKSTVDVTEIFFPSDVAEVTSQDGQTWQDCVGQVSGKQIQGFLVKTSLEEERLFAVKVIRNSFPGIPILTVQ